MVNHKRTLGRRRLWLPGCLTIIWASTIFVVSAWPTPLVSTWPTPPGPQAGYSELWPLLGHISMYAILAPLFFWLGFSSRLFGRRDYFILIIAFVLATLYGVAMEAYQATVPTRDPSWVDGVANALGAAIGLAAVHFLRLSLRR